MDILLFLTFCIIGLYFFKKYMSGPNFPTSGYSLIGKYAVITGGNSGIGK